MMRMQKRMPFPLPEKGDQNATQFEHVLLIMFRFICCFTGHRSAEVASKHRHRFHKTALRRGVDCCDSAIGFQLFSLQMLQSTNSAAQAPRANCCLLSQAFSADSARHSECGSNWNIFDRSCSDPAAVSQQLCFAAQWN